MPLKTIDFFAEGRRFEGIIRNHKFNIPDYQREYSWQKKHIEALLSDLESSKKNGMSHFIGSIVLAGGKDDKDINVIDGQQRLITISLLLASLSKLAKETAIKDDILAKRKEDLSNSFSYYLTSEEKSGKSNIINISRNSNEFYSRLINGNQLPIDNLREEEKLLKKNFEIIHQSFRINIDKYKDDELKLNYLSEMLEIIENISIIPIYVDNEYDAYTIFEVLNDRGLDLNIGDLLKNLLFQKTSSENKEKIKKLWEEMITVLEEGKISITQFIRHYWLSKEAPVREKDLYEKIREKVKSYNDQDITDFINTLLNNAKNYKKLYNPQLENFGIINRGKSIFTILNYIDKFKVKQCYPLILSLYNRFNNNDILPDDFESYLFNIEKFSFIYIRTDLSPSKIEGYYSEHAILIANCDKKLIDNYFKNLVSNLKKELSIIDQKKIFDLLRYEKDGNNKIINYVLQRLDLGSSTEINIDGNTIEHIYPKSSIARVGYCSNNNCNQETAETDIHKIGNLTLITLDDNQALGSKENFDEKKEVYKTSRIKLTNSLYSHDRWDKENIDRRHNDLFLKFKEIWSI